MFRSVCVALPLAVPSTWLRGREATSARYLLWLAVALVASGLIISLRSSASPTHFAKREHAVWWVFLGGAALACCYLGWRESRCW